MGDGCDGRMEKTEMMRRLKRFEEAGVSVWSMAFNQLEITAALIPIWIITCLFTVG